MWPLYVYFMLTGVYFVVSFIINLFSSDFDLKNHKQLVEKYKDNLDMRVDIFLPTAGEDIEVLRNTWNGVMELKNNYQGALSVYCLDDSSRKEVRDLASLYNFIYVVRPKRGWFKKSGNLRYGYKISNGEFIAIFDADFRPRKDFLDELLPYFLEYKDTGLVQSPQYFDVLRSQNWLQRGAGQVQELFYRMSQVSRQGHAASICVGSNAIYRRDALAESGGTALIQHSEDVHTGFNIRMRGWNIHYVPIILAKGLCPSGMEPFFKQQYRWCMGSMSLLGSKKFWQAKISFIGRLSYFSGFLYYIHTAISSIVVPIIPILVLLEYSDRVSWNSYLYILPSVLFVQVIYPLWHNSTYGIEAWSTRSIYGWAHLFAIIDGITKDSMSWQPTGTQAKGDSRYIKFRIFQILFNLFPALAWVYLAAEKVFVDNNLIFVPMLIGGIYYYLICAKVTFFISDNKSFHLGTLTNRLKVITAKMNAFPPLALLVFVSVSHLFFEIPSFDLSNKNTEVKVFGKNIATRNNKSVYIGRVSPKEVLGVDNSVLASTWEYYKKNFISLDGQSIDNEREYKTTSEGQSYIMLRSVLMDDKLMFEKSWVWTKSNLQHKSNDKLFSWLWGANEGKKEKVIYSTNATDADGDIAMALILAGYKWHNQEYISEANLIISDLWELNVKNVNGRHYLLAGAQFSKPKGYVINPSYLSPAWYRVFAIIDRDHPWEKLADDSYYLLQKINESNPETVGLPPNWILLTKKEEIQKASEYIAGNSTMYGYDAFRIFWRVALDAKLFNRQTAKDYLNTANILFDYEWREDKKISAIYSVSGERIDNSQSLSTYVGPLSVFSITNKKLEDEVYEFIYKKKFNKSGYWGSGKSYYEQNWAWFGAAWHLGYVNFPESLINDLK